MSGEIERHRSSLVVLRIVARNSKGIDRCAWLEPLTAIRNLEKAKMTKVQAVTEICSVPCFLQHFSRSRGLIIALLCP